MQSTRQFRHAFDEAIEEVCLKEGIFASYDTHKLVSEVEKIIGTKKKLVTQTDLSDVFSKNKYGKIFTATIDLHQELDEREQTALYKTLNLYGYTNSTKFSNPLQIQLEPFVPVKLNGLIERYGSKNFFHITLKEYLPKIEKLGLAPRDSETTFGHPGNRIYMFWMPNVVDVKQFLDGAIQTLSRNKGTDPSNFTALCIGHNPNFDYYVDDTATITKKSVIAVFTTKNVSPKLISKVPGF